MKNKLALLMGMSVLIGMFSFSAFGLCRYEVVNAEIVLVCDGGPPITSPPNCEEVWVCKGLNNVIVAILAGRSKVPPSIR